MEKQHFPALWFSLGCVQVPVVMLAVHLLSQSVGAWNAITPLEEEEEEEQEHKKTEEEMEDEIWSELRHQFQFKKDHTGDFACFKQSQNKSILAF